MGRKRKARAEPTSNVIGSSPSPEMAENNQHEESPGNIPAKKNSTKSMKTFVRRSGRFKNLTSHMPNKNMVVEEIDLVDNDEPHHVGQLHNERKDPQIEGPRVEECRIELHVEELNIEPKEPQIEGPHVEEHITEIHVEELSNEPKEAPVQELSTEPISGQQNLEDKIGFLVQCVKEFKSMVPKRTFQNETEFAELNYKNLYIDSQKKIDSLVDENHELGKKLQFALGKVEAYEQMKDAIGNLKEMMLFSNLAKVTEAVLKFSSEAGIAKCNFPAVGSPAADDNLPAAAAAAAANGDEPKASPGENERARKKGKASALKPSI